MIKDAAANLQGCYMNIWYIANITLFACELSSGGATERYAFDAE